MKKQLKLMLLLIVALLVVVGCSDKEEGKADNELKNENNVSNDTDVNNDGGDSETNEEETSSKWEVTSEADGIKYFKGNETYELEDTAAVYNSDGDVEYEMTITSFMIVDEMGSLMKRNEENYYIVANTKFENVGEKDLEDRYYLSNIEAISKGATDPLTSCNCALKDSQLGALDVIQGVSFNIQPFERGPLATGETDEGQMVFEVSPAETYDIHVASWNSDESTTFILHTKDAESAPEGLKVKDKNEETIAFGEKAVTEVEEGEVEFTLNEPTYREITYYMNSDNVDFDEKVLEFSLEVKNNSDDVLTTQDIFHKISQGRMINETGVKRFNFGSPPDSIRDEEDEVVTELKPGESITTSLLFDKVRPFEGDFEVYFQDIFEEIVIGERWSGSHTDIEVEKEEEEQI